jgi:hypothetical protein
MWFSNGAYENSVDGCKKEQELCVCVHSCNHSIQNAEAVYSQYKISLSYTRRHEEVWNTKNNVDCNTQVHESNASNFTV